MFQLEFCQAVHLILSSPFNVMLIRMSIICDIASLSLFWVSEFVSSAKAIEKNVGDKIFREVTKATLPISTDSPAWQLLRTSPSGTVRLEKNWLCFCKTSLAVVGEDTMIVVTSPSFELISGGFLRWEEVLGQVEVAFCFREMHMNGILELRKKGLEQDKLSRIEAGCGREGKVRNEQARLLKKFWNPFGKGRPVLEEPRRKENLKPNQANSLVLIKCPDWNNTVSGIANKGYDLIYAMMFDMQSLRYDYDLCMSDITRHVHQFLSRVGLWFELEIDWPPQPLHSCAPGTNIYVKGPIIIVCVVGVIVVLAERKLTSYAYAV
ncbi:hypothetical protein TIFTF001_049900, partial [Ficus carica]